MFVGIVPARGGSVKQHEGGDQFGVAAESILILSGCRHWVRRLRGKPSATRVAQAQPCLRAGMKTDILDSVEFTRRPCLLSPPRIEKPSYEASSDSPLP